MSTITVSRTTPLLYITLNRPECRNAVDGPTAHALADAFREFERDPELKVALLSGAGGHFCAGADLKAIASGDPLRRRASLKKTFSRPHLRLAQHNRLEPDGDGPMGPTRMQLSKPVIAVISGYCVAGGLELALWCDLRIADETAVFGVFCRRFGVPLIDGGTVRLPRAIGMSRALDLILTGRAVEAPEALQFGLANRVVKSSELMEEAGKLALQIANFPNTCLRNDRRSAYAQWGLPDEPAALRDEFRLGLETLASGETATGAARFHDGAGRHGKP